MAVLDRHVRIDMHPMALRFKMESFDPFDLIHVAMIQHHRNRVCYHPPQEERHHLRRLLSAQLVGRLRDMQLT